MMMRLLFWAAVLLAVHAKHPHIGRKCLNNIACHGGTDCVGGVCECLFPKKGECFWILRTKGPSTTVEP